MLIKKRKIQLSIFAWLIYVCLLPSLANAFTIASASTSLIVYKTQITVFLFVILSFITYQLFVIDKQFRTIVKNKLSITEVNKSLELDGNLLRSITFYRVAFVIGLIVIFFFVLFTYQYYENQNLVKLFAFGIFLLNLVGSYLFGSFKRSHQMADLIKKLSKEIRKKEEASSMLIDSQERLKHQTTSLTSLATLQLNKQTMPKVYFRQLIRQSAETLNVSRVSIWIVSQDKQFLECESNYELSERRYTILPHVKMQDCPQYLNAIKQDRVLAIDDVNELADREPIFIYPDHVPHAGAMLNVSIWHKDELIGLISHQQVGESREWQIDEKNYVGSLADLLRLSMESYHRQIIEDEYSKHQKNVENIVQRKIRLIENNAKLFRFIVQRAPISIIYLNKANAIIEFNPESETMLACQREQVIGHNFVDTFLAPASKKIYEQYIKEVNAGHKLVRKEITLKRLAGKNLNAAISASMEVDEEGQPAILLITQDISQQKQLEQSLKNAKNAAESADRTKSMFVASMSHELRTPLNSVIGFLNVVLQGMSGELNSKQKDQLNRAYVSAKHLLALISDVIDISKIEAGFLETNLSLVNLNELLEEVQHVVEHLMKEKKLSLFIKCNQNYFLNTDKKRLYQVILNVVSNAVKYTEQGEVNIRVSAVKKHLEIEVQDTGIGMDAAGVARLFKPFERIESSLKIKTTGTGLGLYLTNKILTTQLGGTIDVKSELGKGSVFTISLPYQSKGTVNAQLSN